MKRDYVLVLDRSGSMSDPVRSGSSQTRWDAAQEATLAVARECAKLDPDGIDVYTFGTKFQRFQNTTPDKVGEIFNQVSPAGGTDFVPVLSDVFAEHFKKAARPTTVLVVTDGAPSEGPAGQAALAKLIVATSNKLEADAELAVQFIQIGQDPNATTFLRKLDDDLVKAGAKYDIVDSKTSEDLENMTITQMLLAAVND